jgi:hypothetical protein
MNMFRKKPKDYLELSDVRVSYDENDDSVNITGKDKNRPKYINEVHLKLDGESSAEYMLRGMLEDAGIITDDHYIPREVNYDDIADSSWDEFPLGKAGGTRTVVWNPINSPHLLVCGPVGSGKSVIAHSIIFHCLQNPEKWRVIAVDPWDDFSRYKKYAPTILGVAKKLEEAVDACQFVLEKMLERYEKMEEFGVTNYQDLPNAPYGMIFLIDEISGFFAESGSKAASEIADNELKREAATIITKISQLGHAAGIHLVLTSQHPDSSVLNGLLKVYMSTEIVMGRVDAVYSSLVLGHSEASHIPSRTKGRGYIQERGKGKHFQAAYKANSDLYAKWPERNKIDLFE